ncbi:MAG: restriction endonuclease subunit S [Methylotenera sp.]
MKFDQYKSYKKTNISLFREVPLAWNVVALQYVARLKSGLSITALDFDEEAKYPVYGGNGFRGFIDKFTHEGTYVLIGRQGALCGNINIAKEKFFATEHALVVTPTKKLSTSWLAFTLTAMELNQYSVSAAQPGLSAEVLARLKIALPSIEEQQKIADFLDFKTAQIDALIAKKEALLLKLQEKRSALITQSVTKGINPNAPMKPSGVEWLGNVPAHWKVIPIKFALDMPITDGPHSTPEFFDDGIPFLSAESVKNDLLDFNKKRGFISLEDHVLFSKKYKPQRGDVYMVKSGATTGNVARVTTDVEFNIWSPLAVLRPHKTKSITDFIFYILKSKAFFYSVELSWSFGTQQNIGMGVISNIRIALPPVSEQIEICKYITPKIAYLELQKQKIENAIAKLQEYRHALITSAVTGKIDVRNFDINIKA